MQEQLSESELVAAVAGMVMDCEHSNDADQKRRVRALEYYNGVMNDLPADVGRSQAVSRDLREHHKKILPSIFRIFFGSDKVVEYQPVGEGDEAMAEQATDYVNHIVIPECDGDQAIYDAMHDALLYRVGVLKWYAETQKTVEVSSHSGLSEIAAAELVASENAEVLAQSVDENGNYGLVIKRTITGSRIRLECLPPEEFLIHPGAKSIDESPICVHRSRRSRSDLISVGFDKELVDSVSSSNFKLDIEQSIRDESADNLFGHQHSSVEEVDYYECYVRIDQDGDGIAELRRIVFIGGLTEKNLVSNDYWDEMPFGDLVAEREPHRWQGRSAEDDLYEIQKIKTALLRNTLDNVYWQNNLQPIVNSALIDNPESVMSPQFGMPIMVRAGADVRSAVGYSQVPFVGQYSIEMFKLMDDMAQGRTGINDASSGFAADALQNMTAKASAMIEQSGISSVDMIARSFSKGLRRVFKGLLKLVIQHQDKARTVRLRNEWVQFDPREWNASMDAVVNTGLGAGTRERDMMMLQTVMSMQEKIVAQLGADNPFVKPDNIWNSVSRLVEAAGLKTPSLYFTKPDPQEVQARLEAQRNAPNPEEMKLQASIAIEKAKAEAAVEKERAQLSADMQTREADFKKEIYFKEQEAELEKEKLAANIALEKMRIDLEYAKLRLNTPQAPIYGVETAQAIDGIADSLDSGYGQEMQAGDVYGQHQ